MPGNDTHRASRVRGHPDPETRDEYSCAGTIIAVYPNDYACKVRDDLKGAEHDVAIPGLIQDPEGSGGEVAIPRVGTRVELKFGGAMRPRIIRCLPQTLDVAVTSNETPPLFESEQPDLNLYGNAPTNFRGYMPTGLMPGDWCRLGNQGQFIGIFDQAVAELHGAQWAKIRAVGGGRIDTLSIFGRRTNIHTDFGDLIFGSEGGKSYIELKGGTDQTLESGVDRQNWTVKAAIGKGEGLANFAIFDRDGETLFKTVVDTDGTVKNVRSGNSDQEFTGQQSLTYGQAFSRTVQNGNDTLSVQNGDRIENYLGNQETQVNSNRYVNILSDDSLIVNNNIFKSSKTYDMDITGRLDAIPGDAAAEWKFANGSLDIHIGKPPTDLNAALSGLNVTVYPAASKIALKSLLGSIETFSSIETKMESAALMNLFAGGAFKAESVGLMEIKSGAAVMGEATGVMQMTSKIGSMFGSSAITQLGGLGAVEPVVKGLSFLPALAAFLGVCSAAGKASAFTGGSVPSVNGAGVIAIGTAADVLISLMSTFPSLKVMTE
jgi:hypothetical protein